MKSVSSSACVSRPTSSVGLSGRSPLRPGAPTRRPVVQTRAFFDKIFKQDPSDKTRKQYQDRVDAISALEPKMAALTDDQLRAKTKEFQKRVQGGETLEAILPEAFAVVREASKRVLGLRPFDVQLIGGMILHEGQIAEMRTGEGKTLVAVLPSYLNALTGKGVHVVTVNDYLARRDSEWVGQVPRFLGMQVGLVQADMTPEARRAAYLSDITYVTNSELGFDYLRDNLAGSPAELVLRAAQPFNFCVIDEVDSILIDEARTPLIISGTSDKPSDKYYKAAKIADALTKDLHYTVDEKQRNVLLTEDGYEAVEDVLQVSDLYDPRTQWASYIINAIKAKELFVKDVNYIVKKDECDGVLLEQYKWRAVVTEIQRIHREGRPVLVGTTSVEKSELLSEMLGQAGIKHQVLNAKPENVERESEIVAQSGRRGAVTISTNMAGRGTDILLGGNPDYMARLKLRELLMPEVVSQADAADAYAKSRTGRSQVASFAADPAIFPCQLSAATLAAGKAASKAAAAAWGERSLPLLEAEDRLSVACEKGSTDDEVLLKLRAVYQAMLLEFKAVTDQEKADVVALGGLHVVGTERHESRRIDNQLRGRSGRQGDPGSTRFFLSLEDSLFRVFGGDRIKNLMVAFRVEDLPMESQMLSDALDTAQKRVESYFYDIRKNLFDYDQVVNTQRDRVYAERRRALLSDSLRPAMIEYAERTCDDILEANVDKTADPAEWRLDALAAKVVQYCPLLQGLTGQELLQQSGGSFEGLRSYLRQLAVAAYEQKAAAVDDIEPGLMQEAQKFFVLTQTDNLWKEHLQAIKFLQQAVGLRGYASKDPLTEFKLEGYNLFLETMAQIRRNVIYNVYVFQPQRIRPDAAAGQQQQEAEQAAASGNGKQSRRKAKASA
uniref:chloroplast protein-transporting ATPase n=1 Tax=Tetradesmus obliquus TaxID=3088 RepID=A0A383WI89_TETOB|eukprot:jgi/Sobl393_1/1287/SZX77195.1